MGDRVLGAARRRPGQRGPIPRISDRRRDRAVVARANGYYSPTYRTRIKRLARGGRRRGRRQFSTPIPSTRESSSAVPGLQQAAQDGAARHSAARVHRQRLARVRTPFLARRFSDCFRTTTSTSPPSEFLVTMREQVPRSRSDTDCSTLEARRRPLELGEKPSRCSPGHSAAGSSSRRPQKAGARVKMRTAGRCGGICDPRERAQIVRCCRHRPSSHPGLHALRVRRPPPRLASERSSRSPTTAPASRPATCPTYSNGSHGDRAGSGLGLAIAREIAPGWAGAWKWILRRPHRLHPEPATGGAASPTRVPAASVQGPGARIVMRRTSHRAVPLQWRGRRGTRIALLAGCTGETTGRRLASRPVDVLTVTAVRVRRAESTAGCPWIAPYLTVVDAKPRVTPASSG